MHGDEVVGRELLLQLIVYLCDNYGKSQLITNLIESVRLHIVPTLNPVISYCIFIPIMKIKKRLINI